MVYLLIIVALDALFYNRFCFFYVAPPLYDGAARLFQVFIVRKVVLCLGLPLRDVIKTRNAVVITVVGWHHDNFIVYLAVVLTVGVAFWDEWRAIL